MKTVNLLLLTTSVVVLFFTLTPTNIISLQKTDENRDLSRQKSIRHQTDDAGLLFNGVHEEWVRHYMSESHPSIDFVKAMVVDESGNVYVTGQSQSTTTIEDFLTIKYDAQGNEIWTARYRDGYRSEPVSIATDHSGNICVLGKAIVQIDNNSSADFDLVTIKYDRDGKEQWVAKFGNTYRDDEPVGILLDGLGNIYATGNILDENGFIKGTLIKYDSSGKELWAARLSGEANAHVIDNKGNIYLTGKTFLAGHESDFLTAKFNQNGEKQWVATYNGPADQRDESYSIVVDNLGNSYVTGTTIYLQNRIFYKTQYTTIKYDSTGQEKWIAQYTGVDSSSSEGATLALDQNGNVYVTGRSTGSGSQIELTTVKYDNFGEEQWAERYPNNERPVRTAKFIFTDKSGNIYVAGQISDDGTNSADFVTIKYNPQGIEQWAAIFDGPDHYGDQLAASAFDQSANIYVTGTSTRSSSIPGSTDADFVTLKYDPNGNQEWIRYYPGPGISYDRGKALAIDAAGNVYVTGNGYIGAKTSPYLTIKYNQEGKELWMTSSDRPDSTANFSRDIAVDKEGNAYVLGYTKTNSTGQDFFLVKYNSKGIEQWTVQKGGYAASDDEPLALALDAYGNIIVTGTIYRKDSANDYIILKYDPLGALLWESYYTGPNKASDFVSDLATDAFDNIYITGKSWEGGEQYNYATIKYNGAGIEQWVAKYAGPSRSDDEAIAVVVDDSGNVYVSGGSEKDSYNHSQFEFVTIKYDSNGVEQWTAGYKPSLEGGYSRVTNMAVDKKGNVYIIGSDRVEYVTIKYDSQGIETWVHKNTIPDLNLLALPRFIRIDEAGEIYVGGFGGRLIALKLSQDGLVNWMKSYQGPGFLGNMMADFEIDHSGNIYVTSEGDHNFPQSVITTIKYSQEPAMAVPSEDQVEIPKRYILEQNYPNPFNPSTTIRFFLSKQSRVKLQMFSISSEEIATLIDEEKAAGRHDYVLDASKLPSGIYFYRLKVDGFISTKKMLLLH